MNEVPLYVLVCTGVPRRGTSFLMRGTSFLMWGTSFLMSEVPLYILL